MMYCLMMCLNRQNSKNFRNRQRTSLTGDPRMSNVCLYKMLLKEKKHLLLFNSCNFVISGWIEEDFDWIFIVSCSIC